MESLTRGRYLLDLQLCRFEYLGGEGEYDWNWSGPSFAWYVYWFDTPGASVRCQGKEWPILPGHLLFIAPGTQTEGMLQGGRVGHLFMHLELFFPFDRVAPGVYDVALPEGMDAQLNQLKTQLLSCVDRLPDPSTLFLAQSIALFGFSELPATIWPERTLDSAIVRIIQEMEQHPETARSNECFAEEAHMSLSTFERRFKRATGCTPHQFLITKRLQKARILLGTTDLQLEQIAEACGYSDRFSLTRGFKAQFGASPAQYRKDYLGGV